MSSTPTAPESIYDRNWQPIKSWEHWLELWQNATTPDEALGLLHSVFDRQRSNNPNAIRFVLGLADLERWRHHACPERHEGLTGRCTHTNIRLKAVDVLLLTALRGEYKLESFFAACTEDPELFPLVMHWLHNEEPAHLGEPGAKENHHRRIVGELMTEYVVPMLGATYERKSKKVTPVPEIQRHRAPIYKVCFRWDVEEAITLCFPNAIPNDPRVLAGLEEVALEPAFGKTPTTLAEALALPHKTDISFQAALMLHTLRLQLEAAGLRQKP